MRERYLFIRILEACNADCFMCEYALSRSTYRFGVDEFADMLPRAVTAGVGYVRFTGGEPLMHRDVVALVRLGAEHGMRMSLITNGKLLPKMVGSLAESGLRQVIVSIDGGSAETHDNYRRSPGTFDLAMAGLRRARELGLLTRVNTVVGPHNYAEMPALQRILTKAGVSQWELSALKLDRPISYPDPDDVRRVCDPIYSTDSQQLLVPLGKRFYGDTDAEQHSYFHESIPPRASEPVCHVVDDVIYLDAKQGQGYVCSCLPHREGVGGARLRHDDGWRLDTEEFRAQADFFRANGPRLCNGCSTSAAGYSDDVARLGGTSEWDY